MRTSPLTHTTLLDPVPTMAKLSTDPVLELLYGDEHSDAQSQALQAQLSDAQREELEDFALLDQAYSALSAHDEPSPTTTQNILREARLAAAERATKPRASFLSALFTPAFGLAALLLLLSIPTLYFLNRSEPIERADESSDIVAVGVEPSPPEELIARADPKDSPENDDPRPAAAQRAQPKKQEKLEAPAEQPALPPMGSANSDVTPRVAQAIQEPSQGKSLKANSRKERKSAKEDDQMQQQRIEPETYALGETYDAQAGEEFKLNADSSGAGTGSLNTSAGSASSMGNMNTVDTLSPDDAQQMAVGDSAPTAADGAASIFDQGDFQATIDYVNKTLETVRGMERAKSLFYRGMAYARIQDHSRAIDDLRVVVEQHPTFARYDEARYTLAKSLVAIGNPDAARTHLEGLAAGQSSFAAVAATDLANIDAGAGGGINQQTSTAKKPSRKKKKRKKSIDEKSSAPIKRSGSSYDFSEESQPSNISVD